MMPKNNFKNVSYETRGHIRNFFEASPAKPGGGLAHTASLMFIAFMMYFTWSRFEEKSVEERDMILTNRQCYSAMHNYSFVVGTDIEVSHGYWAKLVHTHRLLNSPQSDQLDWVFFADADFFITNFDRPLESYIPTDDGATLPPKLVNVATMF